MITMRLKTRATLLLGGWLPDVGANWDHIAVALISNIVFFFLKNNKKSLILLGRIVGRVSGENPFFLRKSKDNLHASL